MKSKEKLTSHFGWRAKFRQMIVKGHFLKANLQVDKTVCTSVSQWIHIRRNRLIRICERHASMVHSCFFLYLFETNISWEIKHFFLFIWLKVPALLLVLNMNCWFVEKLGFISILGVAWYLPLVPPIGLLLVLLLLALFIKFE